MMEDDLARSRQMRKVSWLALGEAIVNSALLCVEVLPIGDEAVYDVLSNLAFVLLLRVIE